METLCGDPAKAQKDVLALFEGQPVAVLIRRGFLQSGLLLNRGEQIRECACFFGHVGPTIRRGRGRPPHFGSPVYSEMAQR